MTHAIFISFLCLGIFAATWPGMILHKPAEFIQTVIKMTICKLFRVEMIVAQRVTLTICKPLFKCLICMASFWTILIWLIDGHSFMLIPMIIVVAGINTGFVAVIKDIMPYDSDENQ